MNEKNLADRCRAGDREALSELYDLYSGRMLSVCLRYCNSSDTASDMLQNGFIKVFRSFDKFKWRGEGSLRAWMTRIFVNECLQQFRSKDVMRGAADVELVNVASEEPSPDEVARIPEKILLGFISSLPDGTREVFNLSVFEEMKPAEISRRLGIKPASVTSQLSRAKTKLAYMVRGYWNNEN